MSATRRLAAILAADVAGYSRLIGRDEQGTLEQLRAIRNELIDPTIAAHNGRIVKRTGDGFLAEFASSVDALSCAEEIQAQMADRNLASALESRIDFRIGIHQGDIVVEEDGDIFGDGVNIAARLEGLAEPGGICVSARVQEDAAGKLDLVFRDLGEQQLKNIARTVRAYAIDTAAALRPLSISASVPRLSIVVLPFANLNNDPEQQYFADAITEDLTTDLSGIDGTFVISRNTAFTYQGRRIETRQIGRELGVRYVLEGSVRRSGDHIRINAQLIDAQIDAHWWTERFDGNIGDLLALQDEVTRRIAHGLSLELAAAEAARSTDSPDALDYIFRGRAAFLKTKSSENYEEQVSMYERALTLDPRSVEAQSRLAISLTARVLENMTRSPAADLARAEVLAEKALAASPRSAWFAHHAKAQVLRAQNRYAEAIPEYETSLALNRNWVNTLHHLGQCKLLTGSIAEAIPFAEQAVRLSPRDPEIGNFFFLIGRVHLLQSRVQEAISWLERARAGIAAHSHTRAWLAAAFALNDDIEQAAAQLSEARRLSSDDRFLSVTKLRRAYYWGVPSILALHEATFFAGLRKAGMPEE